MVAKTERRYNVASRLMHLAIADEICKRDTISDRKRFLLGSILPDAKIDSALRSAPHYQIILSDGRLTYDLSAFRKSFGEKLLTDGLYLGYYLHLIQDMVYRQYMYALPYWDARIPGNVVKLHADYRKINRHIIDSRRLKYEYLADEDFADEEINKSFGFEIEKFLRELELDFQLMQEGEYSVFTPAMAEEYIALALEASLRELSALRSGGKLADEFGMTWGKE